MAIFFHFTYLQRACEKSLKFMTKTENNPNTNQGVVHILRNQLRGGGGGG